MPCLGKLELRHRRAEFSLVTGLLCVLLFSYDLISIQKPE